MAPAGLFFSLVSSVPPFVVGVCVGSLAGSSNDPPFSITPLGTSEMTPMVSSDSMVPLTKPPPSESLPGNIAEGGRRLGALALDAVG